ncbi:ribonuclease H-like domain-containing protein [Lentinula raphanica]|nr:ribonuclease H-like domain-containing protein [Lentinula raphanica]
MHFYLDLVESLTSIAPFGSSAPRIAVETARKSFGAGTVGFWLIFPNHLQLNFPHISPGVAHLLRYDELRRQYLQTIVARLDIPGQRYTPFLPFEDTSDQGFHGFVPSGQWLRNVYDEFIESHKQSIQQHTSMLTGRVCAIDHSHKLAKHIAKVDGVPIFTALLTVTNNKGEIRFTGALQNMKTSLKLYGHQQPEVFYTDNIADKGMLEECFPSLLEDLVPVEKHSNLPLFSVPADIIHILSTVEQIDNTLRAIMDRLPPSNGVLVVGFDAEWNVDVSEDGRVKGKGPTAVVQIALKDEVYILQVGEQLASSKLPHQLVRFLRERRILKAGRMVNGDLRHLETVSGQGPFLGGLELSSFAKERFLISDARMSLADLTATILGRCLPKNRAERISTNWEDAQLSPSQIDYAAKDVYASLLLFHEINKTPPPTPVLHQQNSTNIITPL